MKVYIASGWFSNEQEAARIKILNASHKAGFEVYSPKDHGLYVPGQSTPSAIFTTNIAEIIICDAVVASTVGKDMGTVFECGFAFSLNKPIIYFWEGKSLNLMLSESGYFVAKTEQDLYDYLLLSKNSGSFRSHEYTGDIE